MQNFIDETLYNIWKTAEFHYSTLEQKAAQRDVYNSIEWYINTDRASTAWIKAIAKADPKKIIGYILKAEDQSVTGQIESTTKYLKRYCGLHK